MSLDSMIFMEEMLDNEALNLSSSEDYFPAKIVFEDGEEYPALFTRDQIDIAMDTADREDVLTLGIFRD